MKRIPFILVFLFALATSASAQQSTISGIVAIHNSEFNTGKRQYVTNAQVEDDFQKANAQLTDAQGVFKLIFVGVPEKTTVNLILKREGLEVVNIDALGAVTGQRDQVRLFMAAPNKIAEYRKKIYNIGKTEAEKNLTALLQKKEKAIEALQKDAKANAAKIQTLQTEYAALAEQRGKIDQQAQELASKYAPINLDDASPLYQDAFRSFQKGELDQALKILQQANLTQQAQKILQERQGIASIRKEADQRDSIQQQRTADVIAALLFKADLHKNRYEFDSTTVCYEIMLQLDSTNPSTLGRYASFLAVQRQDQKAIQLYEQALSFATIDELKATFLDKLGNLYRTNQQMPQAEKAYEEALQIRRQLAAKNPDAFLPDVALTLNNLGVYYSINQRMPEAQRAYEEALQIRRQLAAQNPDAFLPDVAATLNNLGVYYRDNQRMPEAQRAYEEALQIRRQLAAKNPDAFLPNVAQTLNNLGNYYFANQKMAQAESTYQEALQMYRLLAAKNPDAFLPNVAVILNNLGIYYRDNQQMPEAQKAHVEALQIYRPLAAKNPDAFLPDVATTLNNLGVYYKTLEQYESALKHYGEAIALRERAIQDGSTHFVRDWVRVRRNISEVRDSAQTKNDYINTVKASQLIAESCDHLKSVNEELLPFAVYEYGNLSWWALFTKDFVLSEKAALRCLELDREEEWVLANLGHSYLLRGQYSQAQKTYEKLKGKKDEEGKDYKQGLLDGFAALEQAGITHPDMAKMKAWIESW